MLHFFGVSADLQAFATTTSIYWPDRFAIRSSGHATVEHTPIHRPHRFGDSHAVQSIRVRHFTIIEPRAVARLPLVATHHTELRRAATLHVVAAFAQLDHGVALVAALPALFLSLLHKPGNFWILGTVGGSVEFARAHGASFRLALGACGALAAFFVVEVGWADPDSAAGVGAVDAVVGVILVIFLVEGDFEFEVEEVFHVRQGDMIGGAATRWHVGGVVDGHAEEAFQA